MVGLSILEAMRSQDRPEEYLTEEDPTVTLPRRFGLSDVIGSRIRYYEQAVRKKSRVASAEINDLVALVVRRPDSDQVFRWSGRALVDRLGGPRRYRRVMKKGLLGRLARRRLSKDLAQMFGGSIGTFEAGSLTFVSRDPLFLETDPGGDPCNLVSGVLEAILSRDAGEPVKVSYVREVGVHGPQYRWSVRDAPPLPLPGPVPVPAGDPPSRSDSGTVVSAADPVPAAEPVPAVDPEEE